MKKNIFIFLCSILVVVSLSCKKQQVKKKEKKLIGTWEQLSIKDCAGKDYWNAFYTAGVKEIYYTFSEDSWNVERVLQSGIRQNNSQNGWSLSVYKRKKDDSGMGELYDHFVKDCGAKEEDVCFFNSGFSDDGAFIEMLDDNNFKLYNDDGAVLTFVKI